MNSKYVNKKNLEMVGKAGYRIGKDIVREGTKAVAGKAIGTAVAVTLKEGFGSIKKIGLDDVLGDLTRIEKKKAKKIKRMEKKQAKAKSKVEEEIEDIVKESVDEKEVTE